MWIGIRCIKGNTRRFATFVGSLITDIKQKIIFISKEGFEKEVVTRLARVGYDHACGYLKGGIKAWGEAGYEIAKLEITPITALDEEFTFTLLDVRNPK